LKAKTQYFEPVLFEFHDSVIEEFLNAQIKSTKKTYSTQFRRIIEFCGQSGEEILRDKEAWEKKAFALVNWLREKGYGDYSINTCIATLRSFFAFNRKPLFFTSGERKKLKPRKRVNEDYLFDQDMLYKMYLCGTVKARYVVAVGKSIGFRASDFSKLTYGQFRALDLNQQAPIYFGEFLTQKEGVRAFAYLDSDAIQAVKALLEAFKDKPDEAHIWCAHSADLSKCLQNLARKANVDPKGKKIRFHALRKFLFDSLNRVMSFEKAKMVIGKQISEEAYLNPETLKEDYARVMSLTALNGNGTKQKLNAFEEQLREKDALIKQQQEEIEKLKSARTEDKAEFRRMFDDYDRELLEVQHRLGIKGKAVKGEPDVT
jgi:succinate dehydrogenase flavin-adding protein (antitoxin of CptAB toxin-antitoxin module)